MRLAGLADQWESRGKPSELLLSEDALLQAEEELAQRVEYTSGPPSRLVELLESSRQNAETVRASRVSLSILAQRAFVAPARTAFAEGRYDAALRLMAAGAILLNDPSFGLDAETPLPHRFALWRAALAAVQNSSLAILHGHSGSIWKSVFSRDGSKVITGHAGGAARVWNVSDGKELAVLHGHDNIIDVALSSSGHRALTTPISWESLDDAARLWDVETGAQIAALRGGKLLQSGTFSPDGSRAIVIGENSVAIWDAETGSQTTVLRGHSPELSKSTFTSDGSCVVTIYRDGAARVWDVRTGAPSGTILREEQAVSSFEFSFDALRAINWYDDNTARVWDRRTGNQTAVLAGHVKLVACAAFRPDGTKAITGSQDHTARIWDLQTGATLAVLQAHEKPVILVAFSADGKRVITCSDDATARVWDPASGAEIAVLRGHEQPVTCAAFSPDGNRVLTGSNDQTARLWDAETGAEIAILRGHEKPLYSVAFAPDGTKMISLSFDGAQCVWDSQSGERLASLLPTGTFSPNGLRVITYGMNPDYMNARIWDALTGDELFLLSGHRFVITCAAFTADSSRVITGCRDNTARIWDVNTGAEIAVLEGHEREVVSVAFSPDGAYATTWCFNGEVTRVWDARTGALIAVLSVEGSEISAFAFSADSTRSIAGYKDGTARVRDLLTGGESTVLRGHTDDISCVAFSRDATRAITGCALDGTAKVWDLQSGVEVATLEGQHDIGSADFLIGDKLIITRSSEPRTQLWDAQSGAAVAELPGAVSYDGRYLALQEDNSARILDRAPTPEIAVIQAHGKQVAAVAFSPDGSRAFTSSWDETTRAWDWQLGSEIALLRRHKSGSAVCLSPDGTHAITNEPYAPDRNARPRYDRPVLWDLATGADIAVLPGPDGFGTREAFSPDGSYAISVAWDKTAKVWNARTGTLTAFLTMDDHGTDGIAISCDGTRAIIGVEASARIWDVHKGVALATAFRPGQRGYGHIRVNRVAFSWDGSRAVAILLSPPPIPMKTDARNEPLARIIDTTTGAETAQLRGHEYSVTSAAFSPSGAHVITGSVDGTARLWDPQTGAELAALRGHENPVTCVAFSGDGMRAITGSQDGTIRIWDVSRWAAFDGDRAVYLAAALDCGVGVLSLSERAELLMQDAPQDLFAAMMERMTPAQRARVPDVSRRLRAPLHPNCYRFRIKD
jgi:WD40 repeat protein